MESIFLEIIKASPVLGLMLIIWFFTRKDTEKISNSYNNLVSRIQEENKFREVEYQKTVEKNQNIIQDLVTKLNMVEDVKRDVEDIKTYLRK